MALTGAEDGRPRAAPAALAARADALVGSLRRRARCDALADLDGDVLGDLDGAALLGERAALLGLRRRGRISPGGSCRLLPTRDDWIALNLARPDDHDLLRAWLEDEREDGSPIWDFVARAVRERESAGLVARGRLLGLAVATAGTWRPEGPVARRRPGIARVRRPRAPRVVDLSSLWAGPLCTHLLERVGARVIKVESRTRPDGARRGPAAFFDLLHAGKQSVVLDFTSRGGRDALRRLVAAADLVVESSRPRALRQLGLHDEAILAETPGLSWISITGHGARGAGGDWIAFGDDAAVEAGLADAAGDADGPLFCADAVADPLAGLEAADQALRTLARGGGERIDVSLVGAARRAYDGVPRSETGEPAAEPRARRPSGRARPLGADGPAVLRELAGC